MSIEIIQVTATPQSIQMLCVGDGTATTITRDLSKQPFELTFDTLPNMIHVTVDSADAVTGTATIALDGSSKPILTVTLSGPLSAGDLVAGPLTNLYLTLAYQG